MVVLVVYPDVCGDNLATSGESKTVGRYHQLSYDMLKKMANIG